MPFFSLLYFIKILIHDAVDLKLDYQLVLQQRYIYTQSVENRNSRSTITRKARNTLLLEAGEEVARVVVNTDSVAFQRLSPRQERKRMFLLPLGLCYHCRVSELSLLVSWLLNWGFSLLIFYSVLEIFKKKLNICYFTTSGLRSTVLNNLLSSFGGAELQSVPVP